MELDVLGTNVTVDADLIDAETDAIRQQVNAYLDGRRHSFDLAVAFPDSFLGRAMQAIAEIPYSEKRTYGELAAELDTAAVAVGRACGRNPVPVIVPCHRVVAADGIGGYQYPGLKEKLLETERSG
ncbi:MAG: methylated-DNA--[protein]-cysteine S-methyltransferase [Candidatus Nanohaloarchaea archaeon]|nr:methylated-DNA--[protein]-cysteine S-methyltransferase [Candidatus Nanohaloarchaea archaeon]